MIRLHTILFILSLFGQIDCNGQSQIREEKINALADSIAKDNVLKSRSVGYGGVRTTQWETFEKLKKHATDEQLVSLIDHKNAVVRCYSFQALAGRKRVDIFPILLKHINDTTKIETFRGCIVSSQTAGDYFLQVVTPQFVDLDVYKLTTSQMETIDSMLLFDKSILISAKYRLLSDIKPNQKYYDRIREIAVTEKSPVAILALARFQNKNDIEIIKTLFKKEETEYYAAYSAREFPNNAFYPYLTKLFEQEWRERLYDYSKWRILYQALAKYPTETTFNLFDRTINTKDTFRYQTLGKYLLIAIKRYPHQVFESLTAKIKLDDYHMNDVNDEMDIEN